MSHARPSTMIPVGIAETIAGLTDMLGEDPDDWQEHEVDPDHQERTVAVLWHLPVTLTYYRDRDINNVEVEVNFDRASDNMEYIEFRHALYAAVGYCIHNNVKVEIP